MCLSPLSEGRFNSLVAQRLEPHPYKVKALARYIWVQAPAGLLNATVVELVDTSDLSSDGQNWPCGFESRLWHDI